jgi:hypothetical protein
MKASVVPFATARHQRSTAPLRLSVFERRHILKLRWLQKYDPVEVGSFGFCVDAALTGGGVRPLPNVECEQTAASRRADRERRGVMKLLTFAPPTEQQPAATLATADEREAAFQRLDPQTQIHFADLLAARDRIKSDGGGARQRYSAAIL